MKRFRCVAIAIFVTISQVSFCHAVDQAGKFGVALSGGIIAPLNGNVNDSQKLNEVVNLGPRFGVALRYNLSNIVAFEGLYGYGWLYAKSAIRTASGADPQLVVPEATLNIVFSFGPMFGTSNSLSPFISAGTGIYSWKVTEKGSRNSTLEAPFDPETDFAKNSPGISAGGGVEMFSGKDLSYIFNVRYHYVFTEDKARFGATFANQGFLTVSIGFNYYFAL